MSRSKSITVASILQFLWGVCNIVLMFPALARGENAEAGGQWGYILTVLGFTAGVLSIVAAYGTWTNMKWGRILAITVNVFFGFLLLGAVLFASPTVKLAAGVVLLIPIFLIVLLLWRTPRPQQV